MRVVLKPLLLVGLGYLLGLLLQRWERFNPVLYFRMDLAFLVSISSIIAAALWWIGPEIGRRRQRRWMQQVEQIRQMEAEKHRRFLRRLDHELKNPLTAIQASITTASTDATHEMAQNIRSQVNRVIKLCQNLRKLADIETTPLELNQICIDELLRDVRESMLELKSDEKRHINIVLPKVPWPLPPIEGDADLLMLAILNIVDNAWKYSSTGASIELRAYEDGNWIAIEVADTGPGISDEDLPHLGEELFRGELRNQVEGSGMGLALARAIVRRHHGLMSIRSRRTQGTVVTVKIPEKIVVAGSLPRVAHLLHDGMMGER